MSKHSPHINLDNFWPYQTVVLADHISRYTMSVVKSEANINQSQWRVLAAVADKPGRTAAEVTSVTPMDKTIVSRAVNSLIELGLIKKTPSTGDKRRSSLEPTNKGVKAYKKIASKLNETLVDSIADGTPPDTFVKTLKEFTAKMDDIFPKQD